MTTYNVLDLWGKTTKEGADRYHPALYHMVDVAQVARMLLTRPTGNRVRDALHRAWRGADLDTLTAWLPFLIALHDIGKISAPFQGQQRTPEARQQRERLIAAGFTLGDDGDAPPSHSTVSAWWLGEQLQILEPDVNRATRLAIRDAAGGHHGRFATGLRTDVNDYMTRYEPPLWNDLRRQGYDWLKAALGPTTGTLATLGAPERLRPATAALTGLTVIADWVASNTLYFPACQTPSRAAYLGRSAEQALNAVLEVGLRADRPSRPYAGFTATFSQEPRDLQAQIDALSSDDLHTPSLFIIEAPTGEGKTEAALALARRLADHGASDEVYIGLPTMATSNQMFGRIEQFFTTLYDDAGAVRLAHGQAFLVQSERRQDVWSAMAGDSDPIAQRGGNAASAEQALRWFTGSKRALLAPFGVGTVDQIELAGLNVRHAVLRLFGLAGKVVVIDEVHAYDTYMSTILEHTLTWLASMDTSVILLSATLPQARRESLLRHYLAGLHHVKLEHVTVEAAPTYPMLALASRTTTRQVPFSATRRVALALRFVHDDSPAAQAQRLVDLTADGGAVARICNRVDDAQHIYQELKRLNVPHLTLIHARYPLNERLERETRVSDLVGKETTRTSGQRLIIIGTQVLEQSLDYDVDVMVTDLCPIDLLLQRAGRLHRHDRTRPAAHQQPVLYIQHTTRADGLPEITRWERIYAPLVLWRTWLTLRGREASAVIAVDLPNDYRPLIEAVYGTEAPAPTGNTDWGAALTKADAALKQQQANERQQARERLTPEPRSTDPLAVDRAQFTEDEEGHLAGWQIAKTRLGERITVIPLYQVDGGWSLAPGGMPIGPIDAEDIALQKQLLNRSLPISDRRVIAFLGDTGSWKQKKTPPLLKYTPPLVLDAAGRATVNGVTMRLDAELGLVIEGKEQA